MLTRKVMAEAVVVDVLQRRVPVDAEVLMMLVLSVEVVEAVAQRKAVVERKHAVRRKQATGVSSSRTMTM